MAARTLADLNGLLRPGRIRPGFRVLLYHAVGTPLLYDTYGMGISPRLFERHIKTLVTHPYLTPVSFAAAELTPPPTTPPAQVAVTFDDGYKDNLQVAAPILLRYGIPFTVFVTSSYIQSGSPDYMTPRELQALAALPGVTIGAHGVTHARLTECRDKTLRHELLASRCYLEDVTGQPVTTLAYPHGATNRRVCEAAREAGYTHGGCSRFDINGPDRDPLLLCRCEIWASDSMRVFRQKLRGDWDWYRWRAPDPAK